MQLDVEQWLIEASRIYSALAYLIKSDLSLSRAPETVDLGISFHLVFLACSAINPFAPQ